MYNPQQDEDISLYSLKELEVMIRILDSSRSSKNVPFDHDQINAELLRRQN